MKVTFLLRKKQALKLNIYVEGIKMEKDIIELNSELIEDRIYVVRGKKVMLDSDLAKIYGYETKRFNEQVKNNISKFPVRYMFRLTNEDLDIVSRSKKSTTIMQMQGVKGGRVYLPYAFTEQGIYMLKRGEENNG